MRLAKSGQYFLYAALQLIARVWGDKPEDRHCTADFDIGSNFIDHRLRRSAGYPGFGTLARHSAGAVIRAQKFGRFRKRFVLVFIDVNHQMQ